MDEFEITLKNYRAFSQHAPITIRISSGITFLLGVNNVGKSALLRSFFELKAFISAAAFNNARNARAPVTIHGSLPVTLDRIAHRGAPSGPIEVKFAKENHGWQIAIFPRMNAEDFDGTGLKDFILGTLKPLVDGAK